MASLLILNYHRITLENEFIDARYHNFTLAASDFLKHLQLIHDLNIPVIDLSKPNSMPASGTCVALTFDDGHRSDVSIALPLLKKFNFSATFFPVVHHINKEGYVSWEELHLLNKEGHTIGSHGLTHRHLSRLTADEVHNELVMSKQLLERELKQPVQLFSFPYGDYTTTVYNSLLNAGYVHGVSTEFGLNEISHQSVIWKRWNIKRTTSVSELERVLNRHFLTLAKHQLKSQLSKCLRRIQRKVTP